MKRSTSLFRFTAIAAVVSIGLSANVAMAKSFVVKDIRVEGLERISPGTVYSSIPIKVGQAYDDEQAASTIRALYGLGLFSDVRVEPRGEDVVVVVREAQTINEISVTEDLDGFDKKTLLEALGKFGISAGVPFNKSTEDQAIQEVKRMYEAKGYYNIDVSSVVTPIENGRVNVYFKIVEGPSARIRSVNFVGNQAFKSSTLQGEMLMDDGGWMSWYTKSDRYAEDRLNTDLQALRDFYLNRGYLEFRIDSTQAALSQDKKHIDVTINLTEGPRYVVSGVSLAGSWLGKEDEFRSLVSIKPGEVYKLDDVRETLSKMNARFGDYGYAFARVTAEPVLNREQHQVALVLNAAPDQRAYVRNINIRGNAKTRDEVIRREMRQLESSWFSQNKVALSRDRIDRLGYFQDIQIEPVPVPGTNDVTDLDVNVKERPTGSVTFGAGYSTSEKLTFTAGIAQENIFGSGQSFSAHVETGKYNKSVNVSSTDPYFTSSGVSRTFNLYGMRSEPYASQSGSVYDYQVQSLGGNITFGIPISESNTIFLGAGVENYKLKPGGSDVQPDASSINANVLRGYAQTYPGYLDSNLWWKLTPEQYQYYVTNGYKYGGYGLPLTLGWAYDTRDSSLAPTRGMYHRVSGAISPAGDLRYAMAAYRFQFYQPITKNVTFAFNTDLAYGKGLGSKPFPFFKNMYSGGLGSVRGFEQGALGVRNYAYNGSDYAVGGDRKFNVNMELVTPFPGATNDKTLRIFGFLDAGQVYSDNKVLKALPINVNAEKVRVSAGIGLRWISPMGPLSLAFGWPVKKYEGDKLQKVQFQIGTSF